MVSFLGKRNGESHKTHGPCIIHEFINDCLVIHRNSFGESKKFGVKIVDILPLILRKTFPDD